ncbi:hypothetical protein [Tsukamurella paurometabola]|uniref:Uncharacterized protein n=1 Tax=Tsukamurella paurometabola TaxID=2061 RepID=A0A3P8K5C6_TSUPA|nr:hypothetical protein [Tsukamurella paurometabola]UEA83010.1 hypothetical protein LK411_22080 [Tsukamurella paurometabola]VDR40094.1 Uncharacterised protein [Tsukamurella paurometabola]
MTTTANVETLTAEVRVLQVGNRQITKSVYLQLDTAMPDEEFHAFGRVRPGNGPRVPDWAYARTGPAVRASRVELVGLDTYSGALVRSYGFYFDCGHAFTGECGCGEWVNGVRQPPTAAHWLPHDRRTLALISLPLIVLAGLR